jgi:hypothetical protein
MRNPIQRGEERQPVMSLKTCSIIRPSALTLTAGARMDGYEMIRRVRANDALETQIGKIEAAAVFVGENGIGPWQKRELDACLREFVARGCPVIPVLLPNAPEKPTLPAFLEGMTWLLPPLKMSGAFEIQLS